MSRNSVGRIVLKTLRDALNEEKEGKEGGDAGPGQVDWQNLYSLFKKHAGVLTKVCELEKEEKDLGRNLSPEELAALQEIQVEWARAAARARAASKYPLLDTGLLPELVKGSLGGLLNLSEEQLDTVVMESMGEPLSKEALDSATPLAAYAERLDLVDRLEATLPEVLDDVQLETWQSVEGRMLSLFRGEPKYTRLGFDSNKKTALKLVKGALREHYGFPKSIEGVLDSVAGDYLERAREVFQRHGDPKGHLHNLQRPVRERLEIYSRA